MAVREGYPALVITPVGLGGVQSSVVAGSGSWRAKEMAEHLTQKGIDPYGRSFENGGFKGSSQNRIT